MPELPRLDNLIRLRMRRLLMMLMGFSMQMRGIWACISF